MRFRITDEKSDAEEFSASSLREFRSRSVGAASNLAARGVGVARMVVQVASDLGGWASPNYPASNAPMAYTAFGGGSDVAYNRAITSNSAATYFDIDIGVLKKWLSNN